MTIDKEVLCSFNPEIARKDLLDNAIYRPSREHIQEALDEAEKRYPEARAGLVWFINATGLLPAPITQDVLDWAHQVILKKGLDLKGEIRGH